MKLTNFLYSLLSRKRPFYVISHERSGTHFAINTLFRNTYIRQEFSYVGDWIGPYNNPATRNQHLKKFYENWTVRLHQGGIIKSHCDRETFQKYFPKERIVYVLRDPRDTLVSFYHYLNSNKLYETNPGLDDHRCTSFSEFLRRPASDYLRLGFYQNPDFDNVVGRWASHVEGWMNTPGVCVLRYEDLKTHFRSCVWRACRQIGILPRWNQASVSLGDGSSILPRKGITGDWKNFFSESDENFLLNEFERRNFPEKILKLWDF
ncbi:MAG: sulfotransferase domain-containing protein [Chthoniobacterales bacterium]